MLKKITGKGVFEKDKPHCFTWCTIIHKQEHITEPNVKWMTEMNEEKYFKTLNIKIGT